MTQEITKVRKHFYSDSSYCGQWIAEVVESKDIMTGYVQPDGTAGKVHGYNSKKEAEAAAALYIAKNAHGDLGVETSAGEEKLKTFVNGAKGEIRKFDTGATRDTVEGKLDYVKALCPLVLRRYVQYLDKHRLQPDGNMRDFDNWKNGMPRETYHSSKGRHFFADWLLEEGYEVSDNHGPVDEEDALCGELFNTMGKLREILRAKLQSKKE